MTRFSTPKHPIPLPPMHQKLINKKLTIYGKQNIVVKNVKNYYVEDGFLRIDFEDDTSFNVNLNIIDSYKVERGNQNEDITEETD